MYQKTTLPNGLRLVTASMPHTRSVSIGLFIGVGSRYESEPQGGISHFIEHMCFKGTDVRRTPGEISAAIEGVGGVLNGGTDKEMTMYWCKVASPHFTLAMDVLVDMLLNSRFDAADIDKERQVIIEEIKMTQGHPVSRGRPAHRRTPVAGPPAGTRHRRHGGIGDGHGPEMPSSTA